MNPLSSMLNDSITTLLCMMEDPFHPFNTLIPTPINKLDSFYMDSISPSYEIRTTFQCVSKGQLIDPLSHTDVLKLYLNLLIKARFSCIDLNYQDSIHLNQCEYKIDICIH